MEGPRGVKPEEFDSLMELVNTVFSSSQGHMRESFPLLFEYRNWQNLFVAVDGGRVVSHVGFRPDEAIIAGCRLKVVSVGCVGTYEDYRGRGLASACLAAGEKKCVGDGAAVTYISGRRGLYERFGAVKAGRSFVYAIQAGDVRAGLFVREATADDIFRLERLYEQEPVRFHRPLEDWRATFAALVGRYSTSYQDYLHVLGDAEGTTGYVVARLSRWGDAPVLRVTEYAGNREHIIGVLPAIASRVGHKAIDIAVPDYDGSLRRAAAKTGIEPHIDYLAGHTVKVSCLGSFIRGVKPIIEERLGRTGAGGLAFQPGAGGTYEVIIGEERFPFSIPAFTSLAFGNPESETLEGVGFGGGLLGRMFPIPLPLPGLNYV